MPIAMRRCFRFANSLAALGAIAILCVTPMAGAETQATPIESVPALKKKIVLVQFDVANTLHVDDINNIYDGLPSMLADRLAGSGKFLTVYTGRSLPAETGEAQREAIMLIAEETGAQFLVSGIVLNAETSQEKGFWETLTKRQIEIEYSAYDGLTGARLLSRSLYAEAHGDVLVGNNKPFGSMIFLETAFGKATSLLIDAVANEIQDALEMVPFAARIVRVEGKKVFLDAGSDALLEPGFQLVAYAREANRLAMSRGTVLGVTERVADAITLTQTQAQFSVGELADEAAGNQVKANGIARMAPDELRALIAERIAAQQKAKAEQEAQAEAERLQAEQAAQAEAARIKAEQDAKAEAARIKAEKKAKALAAAEAKKKAAQAKAKRVSAAQAARDRAAKARAAAEARAARLKAEQDAACSDAEKEARADVARIKAENKALLEAQNKKAAAEAQTPQVAGSGVVQDGTAAGAEAEPDGTKKKPGVPLKLKPIKP